MGSKSVKGDYMGKYNNLTKKLLNYNMNKFRIITSSIIIFHFFMTSVIAQSNTIEGFGATNGYEWGVRVTSFEVLCYASRDRPEETGIQITEERAIEIVQNFMDKNIDFFGIESYQLHDVKLKDSELFSFWIIDFVGKMHEELPPPEIYIRVLMTSDGQPYTIGDIDAYNTETSDLIKSSISGNQAIESAQSGIGSGQEPMDCALTSDDDHLIWNVKFGDPENKEVLVDANTGEILSIKSTEEPFKSVDFSKLPSPIIIITFSIIIIGVILIMLFFRKRGRLKEEWERE